jgi:hypothetical protein
MKTLNRLLSLTIVAGSLIAHSPAKADTVYHTVYHTSVAAGDPFSILDKYQNNVLTADEYNNGAMTVPFDTVDANHDGFITREEFYAYYRANVSPNAPDLNLIMPAAGGGDTAYEDDQCVPRY